MWTILIILLIGTPVASAADCIPASNGVSPVATKLATDVEAVTQTPLEKRAAEELAEINKTENHVIPDSLIDDLWASILNKWYRTHLPLRLKDGLNDRSPLIQARLKTLLDDLKKRGGFRTLTPDTVKNLKLGGLLCKNEGHCTKIDGFYVPLNHLIFLDTKVPRVELEKTLLHELFHAYQFTYRFPIDLKTLSDLHRQGKIKSKDMQLYLDYYYESQANWKGIQYHMDPAWEPALDQSSILPQYIAFGGLTGVSGYAGLKAFAAGGTGAGLLTAAVVWEGGIVAANAATNRMLPNVAKLDLLHTPSLENGHDPLELPELIPIDAFETRVNLTSPFDFQFHKTFGESVEKYYFGKKKFLNHSDRNDIKIYNELHNQYYSKIGLDHNLEYEPPCQELLKRVRSAASPMVAWLTLDAATVRTCSVYRDAAGTDKQETYKNAISTNDAFHVYLGGEGDKPGLHLLPQLEIKPDGSD